MVFYRDRDGERPLSRILPHLYLGAEKDVTQDGLSARGISYVLSVSRCCPQPAFLPQAQYLRIPIDDSHRDDLLPWIPQALRFIDGAMSLGCSVLVHCAAGVSRSPALAVAYVMYHLGMDLDHAYRFVKECRPSISPNFNFLGQLQHFQGTLPLKRDNANLPTRQPTKSLDTCLQSSNENFNCSSAVPLSANRNASVQDNATGDSRVADGRARDAKANSARREAAGQNGRRADPALVLSLSERLRTLTLSLGPPAERPPQPQTPLGFASLSEKRKSLTLSLSMAAAAPQAHRHGATESSGGSQRSQPGSSRTVQRGAPGRAKRRSRKPAAEADGRPRAPAASASRGGTEARPQRRRGHGVAVPCQSRQEGEPRLSAAPQGAREEEPKPSTAPQRAQEEEPGRAQPEEAAQSHGSSADRQEEAPERRLSAPAVEGAQSPLSSPLNLTVNKLLGWGERMLIGVLLGPRIKVGQAALPYRC